MTITLRKVGEAAELSTEEQNSAEHWQNRGYQKNFGDAAVMSPYFEVLRKTTRNGAAFVILCPTFLRRPLHLELDAHAEIRTFASGIY